MHHLPTIYLSWGIFPGLQPWMVVTMGTFKDCQPKAKHCAPTYLVSFTLSCNFNTGLLYPLTL